MSDTRIEKVAAGDIGNGAKSAHKRTVKRIRHWQRRIWKESHPEDFAAEEAR